MLRSLLLLLAACGGERAPEQRPPGAEEGATTDVLEAGAAALQTSAPVRGLDVHLVGFHPLVDDPAHQVEAHHFCRQVNEDFAQCVLFDGDTEGANLHGVEYIVSERLFLQLPLSERQFWHPHNFEILSGQLVAPGLPAVAERALLRGKMNSYGKTFHTWDTTGDRLPLGIPRLAWSFNRDGEARAGLVEARDERLGIDGAALRRDRQELAPLARPQYGVDRMKGRFPGPVQELPGVVEAGPPRPASRPPPARTSPG